MSVVSAHLNLFWGVLDLSIYAGTYDAGASTSLGPSAVSGVGIGARRVHVEFSRTDAIAEDKELFTMDFVNYTGGAPDDTWTSGDYAALEARLDTFILAIRSLWSNKHTLSAYRWYRLGPGVVAPNPAERVTVKSTPGTAGTDTLPPQVATTISEHTPLRKHWGRLYLPPLAEGNSDTFGRISSAACDTIAAAAQALYQGAKSDDFAPVVFCPALSSALLIESIKVDNTFDVQRRRRWQNPTYAKSLAIA